MSWKLHPIFYRISEGNKCFQTELILEPLNSKTALSETYNYGSDFTRWIRDIGVRPAGCIKSQKHKQAETCCEISGRSKSPTCLTNVCICGYLWCWLRRSGKECLFSLLGIDNQSKWYDLLKVFLRIMSTHMKTLKFIY